MEHVTVGGLDIAFERVGEGPPLVLLHGILADSRHWSRQLDALSADFTVVAWDAPGCGRSSDPHEDWRLPEYAECVAAFLDALGVRRPHVAGLSWGGALALELASRRPAVPRSLVLAGAYAGWAGSLPAGVVAERLSSCLREAELPAEEFVPGWIPGLLTDRAPPGLIAEVGTMMAAFHPVGYRAMARAVAEADLREALRAIDVPTLLVWGDRDRRSQLSVAEELHARIPGSRLVVLRDAGHLANLEAADRFNAEVRSFLLAVGD
jgi:pimeloyl-ACP methyl ester carboxylesterase